MSIHKFFTDIGLDPSNLTFYKALVAFVMFFLPVVWTIIGVVALISLDFITAIIASKKNNIAITSNKASKSIYKLLVYVILICTCLIADRLTELNLFVNFCTYFLVLIEVYSIGENFNKIVGVSFVKYLKGFIESKVKGINTNDLVEDVKDSVQKD